ncbi:MAG: tetratricopeptide repeat protein [Acidobacteriaceae bacterium]
MLFFKKTCPSHPRFVFIATTVWILTIVGAAQEGTHFGNINGRVSGIGGHAISGGSITLSDYNTGAPISTVLTASDGTYVIPAVKYGVYSLTARYAGYESPKSKILTLASAKVIVDLHLKQLSTSNVANSIQGTTQMDAAKSPPSFTAAGVSGSINGSGYSSAASSEEASHVMDLVVGLNTSHSATLAPSDEKSDCNREENLSKAVTSSPNSFEANHKLGEFYLQHGDALGSIDYLRAASRISPENIENSRELAAAYLEARRYATAIALLQHLLQKNGTDSGLHLLLAKAYVSSNMYSEAIREYKLAATLDAGDQDLFESGLGLIDLGSVDEAKRMFASAVVKYPDSASLWLGLGIAEYLLQQKADAVQSLLRAVDIDPEYLPPYSFLANLSGTSSEADTKIANSLTRLIALHPDSPEAHYDYALALWKRYKQIPNAAATAKIEAQLKLAIAQNPQDADAHYLLGVIDADTGDYTHAAEELSQSVELNPDNAEPHYRLALTYRSLKEADLADRQFKIFEAMRTKKTNPNDALHARTQELASQLVQQRSSTLHCPSVR